MHGAKPFQLLPLGVLEKASLGARQDAVPCLAVILHTALAIAIKPREMESYTLRYLVDSISLSLVGGASLYS